MITGEIYEIDIPIYIKKDWIMYEYNSFARGYHAYMNIWNPLVGETMKCMQEPSNEVDKNDVAIISLARCHCWARSTKHARCFSKSLTFQLKFKL